MGGGKKVPDTQRATLLMTVTLGAFLGALAVSATNVALPSIGSGFRASPTDMGWVPLAYTLSTAVAMLPMSRVADRCGQKRGLVWGLRAFATIMIVTGFAPSMGALIGLRAGLGLASGLVIPASTALLTLVYPHEKLGRALGLFAAGPYLGMTIGPLLGGVVTENLGWRALFWVAGALAVANCLLPVWRLPEIKSPDGDTAFDAPGSMLYAAGLSLFLLGFTSLPRIWLSILVAPGALFLVAFVYWERRARDPLFRVTMFRDPLYAACNLAAFINYAATLAVTFLMSFYLQYTRSLSPQTTGLLLIAPALFQATFSPIAGRLSDRLDSTLLATIGMTASTLGLAALSALAATTSLVLVVAALCLIGVGFAFFAAPITHAVMGGVAKANVGAASSALATVRWGGQNISLGLASLIMTLVVGRQALEPTLYPRVLTSVRVSFALFAALSMAGTFILGIAARRRRARRI